MFIFLCLGIQAGSINASIQQDDISSISIRAGHHSGYMRIVLEGPGDVLLKGKVTRVDKGIQVSFPDKHFAIKKEKMPFEYKQDRDIVLLSIRKVARVNHFLLKNPDRFVIDIYRTGENGKGVKPVLRTTAPKKAGRKVKAIAKKHKAKTPQVKKTRKISKVRSTSMVSPGKRDRSYRFIPNEYRKAGEMLESGESFGLVKKLDDYKPKGRESIAAYHYLYGEAYFNLKKHLKSIEHYRLAYIYSSNDELKENALFKRALSYQELGLLHEAKAYYTIFIKNYPSSQYIQKAHLNLAKILAEIGILIEAAAHFGEAGQGAAALFGMANVLQQLDMNEEARLVYADAMHVDETYPDRFPESYYFMGENMRKLGEKKEAKKYFSLVRYGPFMEKASISLGIMAMNESDTETAFAKFRLASRSADRNVVARALLNLSKVHLKEKRAKEAIAVLEDIRHNYIGVPVYMESVFELSVLYRKEGKIEDSLALLKTVIYSETSPKEAFDEVESILLEADRAMEKEGKERPDFVGLWKELGQWVLDKKREKALLKFARRLRHEGEPFLELSSWLVKNASRKIRVEAAIDLADYYVDMGNIDIAKKYMTMAESALKLRDSAVRVEVKIHKAEAKHKLAFKRFRIIKKYEKDDLKMLAGIIDGFKKTKSKKLGEAIALYEKTLKKPGWTAGDYIRFADILFKNRQEGRSLKYYKIAFRKDPKLQWAAYRIGRGTGMPKSGEMYTLLKKGNKPVNRVANSKLREIILMDKMQEVY
jgi:tetratricopeptide (TPR) repeat protein